MSDNVKKQLDIIKENFYKKEKVWSIVINNHVNPALEIRRKNRGVAVALTPDIYHKKNALLNTIEAILNILEEDSKNSHE